VDEIIKVLKVATEYLDFPDNRDIGGYMKAQNALGQAAQSVAGWNAASPPVAPTMFRSAFGNQRTTSSAPKLTIETKSVHKNISMIQEDVDIDENEEDDDNKPASAT